MTFASDKRSKIIIIGLLVSFIGYSSSEAFVRRGYITSSNKVEMELQDQSKLDSLEKKYEKMLKRNPNNVNALIGMGNVQAASYKLESAEKNFRRALKIQPKNSAAHNGLGMVLYYQTTSSNNDILKNLDKIYEEATDNFKRAIQYDPTYFQAYNNLGKVYHEQGLLELADENYRKAIDLNPNYSAAVKNLGTVYFEKGEIDAAIDKYKRAIKLNSKNSSAHYHLGEAYITQGNYGQAIKSLQTSQHLFPNSAPVHDKLGEAYQKQGNFAAAINEYKKAINIKPEYSVSYLKLADMYSNRGDQEFAIAELKTALDVNPDFLEGKMKIADISLSIGKVDQAVAYYNDVLKEDSKNINALKGASRAFYIKAQQNASTGFVASPGAFVDAERALQEALRKSPADLELHLALLRISKLSGNEILSQDELNRIISQPARNPRESIIKGEALFADLRFREADEEFYKALINTNTIDDVLYIGDILAVNGNIPLARSAYNKALQLNPSNSKSLAAIKRLDKIEEESRLQYRTATGFAKEGQRVAAIDGYRKALGLNPKDPLARYNLATNYAKEEFYVDALREYQAFLEVSKPYVYPKEIKKAQKNLENLPRKISSLRLKGEPVKEFDSYYSVNRLK